MMSFAAFHKLVSLQMQRRLVDHLERKSSTLSDVQEGMASVGKIEDPQQRHRLAGAVV
jgi:hypothetical protein